MRERESGWWMEWAEAINGEMWRRATVSMGRHCCTLLFFLPLSLSLSGVSLRLRGRVRGTLQWSVCVCVCAVRQYVRGRKQIGGKDMWLINEKTRQPYKALFIFCLLSTQHIPIMPFCPIGRVSLKLHLSLLLLLWFALAALCKHFAWTG